MIYGVIMAGGKGERFWPLSSESRPKQLLPITSERNMLQVTLDRIAGFIPIDRILIVTGNNIKDAILERCEGLTESNILTEPFGRNTCLAVFVLWLAVNQVFVYGKGVFELVLYRINCSYKVARLQVVQLAGLYLLQFFPGRCNVPLFEKRLAEQVSDFRDNLRSGDFTHLLPVIFKLVVSFGNAGDLYEP